MACAGGEILASIGIREAYETGRGPVTVRGRAFIEGNEASTSAPSSSQDGVTTSTGLALFCCALAGALLDAMLDTGMYVCR